MFYTHKKVSKRTATLLSIGVMISAVVLVMSLTGTAGAQMFSLTGKIVTIDRDAKTLTIDPSAYYGADSSYGGASGLRSFALEHGAFVMSGNEKKNFADLRIGDWVTVSFKEESGGLVVATGIALASPPVSYTQERARSFSLAGKVVAIDREAKTLTIDPSDYYGPDYRGLRAERTFFLEGGPWIMMGSERKDLRDIRVGDWLMIDFHRDINGRIIADGIVLTSPPAYFPEVRAQIFSLTGKVVAINRDERTLTIDPSYYYGPNYSGIRGAQKFVLDRDMFVMMGSEKRGFNDINLGDLVTVNFHRDNSGLLVTDSLAITSPAVLICPEVRG